MMHLPLHPTLSKLVIWGAMFKVLDPILTIAATLDGNNDPFELVIEGEKRQNFHEIRHKFARGESSDHLLFLNLYKTWLYEYDKGKSKKFCQENNVNEHSMNTIYFVREQIYNILESIQLIKV